MPLSRSAQGAARAFLGRASDGQQYWIKVPGKDVGPRMLAADQIVGRLGALMGVATCPVETVLVPGGLNWEYRPGEVPPECVGHASLRIEDASETRVLNRSKDDDNAVRYTSFAALYDLAWGDDIQGLEVLSKQGQFYSHDHGWYLPPGRGAWTGRIVEDYVDVPHPLPEVPIDRGEAIRLAARLKDLTRAEIASALSQVPDSWNIAGRELESIGYYLERRAPRVAERLLKPAGGAP
jgi:hypothetical protein